MNFPNLPPLPPAVSAVFEKITKPKASLKTMVALRISEKIVSAVCWQIKNGKLEVFPAQTVGVESFDEAGVIAAADKAISLASAGRVPEPSEILFGVFASWIEDGKVKDQYLPFLRKIAKDLGFTPLGFVSLPEVISGFYQKLESVPLTAILVGMESNTVGVSLIRAGHIVRTVTKEYSGVENVNPIIENSLREFVEAEVLPSRILVYDGSADLAQIESVIMSYPWSTKLPFLHFPKTEKVPNDKLAEAIAVVGGEQMGGVATFTEEPAPAPAPEPAAQALPEGFAVGSDVAAPVVEKPKFSVPKITLPTLKLDFSKLRVNNKGVFVGIGAVFGALILIAGLVIGGYKLGTSAKVTVFVSQKNVSLPEKEILVSPSSDEIKEGEIKIHGSTVEVTETGSKRGVATGKKLVGDKAKGAVTIVGSLTVVKKFSAGTVIASKGLKFLTDSAVEVASAAGIASPATATVNVTASGIGDSFNLPSGTLFTVENQPATSYQAKNENAFSGGSSRQVTVVSAIDQERLLATLSAELTKKAYDDLRAKISGTQTLLDGAVTSSIEKKRFDRDVDTESESFSLTLSSKHVGVLFEQSDLITLIKKVFAADIPDGYRMDEELSSFNIERTKKISGGDVAVVVRYSAVLVPEVNKVDVTKKLPGLSVKAATDYLAGLTGVTKSTIEISPKIAASLADYFGLPGKLSLEVVSE